MARMFEKLSIQFYSMGIEGDQYELDLASPREEASGHERTLSTPDSATIFHDGLYWTFNGMDALPSEVVDRAGKPVQINARTDSRIQDARDIATNAMNEAAQKELAEITDRLNKPNLHAAE